MWYMTFPTECYSQKSRYINDWELCFRSCWPYVCNRKEKRAKVRKTVAQLCWWYYFLIEIAYADIFLLFCVQAIENAMAHVDDLILSYSYFQVVALNPMRSHYSWNSITERRDTNNENITFGRAYRYEVFKWFKLNVQHDVYCYTWVKLESELFFKWRKIENTRAYESNHMYTHIFLHAHS